MKLHIRRLLTSVPVDCDPEAVTIGNQNVQNPNQTKSGAISQPQTCVSIAVEAAIFFATRSVNSTGSGGDSSCRVTTWLVTREQGGLTVP